MLLSRVIFKNSKTVPEQIQAQFFASDKQPLVKTFFICSSQRIFVTKSDRPYSFTPFLPLQEKFFSFFSGTDAMQNFSGKTISFSCSSITDLFLEAENPESNFFKSIFYVSR